MTLSTLPKGWIKKISKTYGIHYYLNLYTKKSQWERPTETEEYAELAITDRSLQQQNNNKLGEKDVAYENESNQFEEQLPLQEEFSVREETTEPVTTTFYYDTYFVIDEDGYFDDEPEQIRCSHIIVKHKHSRKPYSWRDDKINRTPKEALAIIKCYRKEIMRSKRPRKKLEAIASQYSDCPTASKGGDLGFLKKGEMLGPFEEAAFSLEINELSQPIWTDSGIHIIMRTA